MKRKSYFTIFGILCATVNRKMHSCFCSINTIMSKTLAKITRTLLNRQLKPINLYSTNNI